MLANRPAKIQNRFVSTRKVKGSIEYHVWDNENNITEVYYQVPIHNQNSHEYRAPLKTLVHLSNTEEFTIKAAF